MFHEPAYSDLGKRPNNTNAQKYLQPFCEQYGIELVFAGHNHIYAHCIVNGVNHFTFGGGGSELHSVSGTGEGLQKSVSAYNYGRITLTEDKFNVIAVDPDGNVLDNVGIPLTADIATDGIIIIDVYPNPSSDIIYYNLPEDVTNNRTTLYNNMGSIVLESETDNTNYGNLNISQVATGQYMLEITTNSGTHTQPVSVIR